jgi:hypothetical protein
MWKRSIAGLMALVVFIAVGVAALARPSRLWAAALVSGVLVTLAIAVIGAVLTRGPRRAFWTGFAVAGLGYVVIHYAPLLVAWAGPSTLSTTALDLLYTVVESPEPPRGTTTVAYKMAMMKSATGSVAGMGGGPVMGGGMAGPGGGMARTGRVVRQRPVPVPYSWASWTEVDTTQYWSGSISPPLSFYRVGHALFALLIALAGGTIGRRMARPDGAEDRVGSPTRPESRLVRGEHAADSPGGS